MDQDDEDLDTHMCLRCKTVIHGLGNYVLHRRQSCPAMLAKNESDVTSDKDVPSSDTLQLDSARHKLGPDDFFLSLELQSKNTVEHRGPKKVPMGKKCRSQNIKSRGKCLRISNDSKKRKVLSDNDCGVGMSDEEDDCDDRHPPKGHTGGKWKPGSMPTFVSLSDHPDSCSIAKGDCNACPETSTVTVGNLNDTHADGTSQPESHRCGSCNLSMSTEDMLIQHLMEPSHWEKSQFHPDHEALVLRYATSMASNAPFRCNICKFYFNDLKQFIDHWDHKWKQHSLNNVKYGFACSLCSARFKTPKSVTKHLLEDSHANLICCKTPLCISAPSSLGFPCSVCSYVARTWAALDMHRKRNHASKLEKPSDGKVPSEGRVCRFCDMTFTSLTVLKEHAFKSHPNELFQCKSCELSFFSKSQHYKHCKSHDTCSPKLKKTGNVATGSLLCKTCDFSCDIKAEQMYHEALHGKAVTQDDIENGEQQNKFVKSYSCPECEQLIPKCILLNHLIDHTGEKPFKCSACGVAFSSKNSLYQHEKGNHGEKNLSCPHCNFKTHKKFRLQRHLTTHELLRPRPFLCEMCGAGFLENYALRYHMKLHVGDKCHKCSFKDCDKAYRSASELIVHVRTHTDERPFLCTECGYAAKTRHQLTKHERKHNGQRPFKCPHCPYAAKLSAQLWRHIRTHTGARPYSCPHCSYTCNTSENLRKHVLKSKKHQGLKIYICPYCSDFGCNHVKEFQDHVTNNHKDKIDVNESLTPTYLSLLSGVYDKSVSVCEVKDNAVTLPRKSVKTEQFVQDSSDVNDDSGDVELRESLAFLKEAEDFDMKSEDKLDGITMVSIELIEPSEETVITSERCDDSQTECTAVAIPFLADDGTEVLTENCSATLNAESNTIVIYVPMS